MLQQVENLWWMVLKCLSKIQKPYPRKKLFDIILTICWRYSYFSYYFISKLKLGICHFHVRSSIFGGLAFSVDILIEVKRCKYMPNETIHAHVFKETNKTCFRGYIVFQVNNTDWRKKVFSLVHILLKLIYDFNTVITPHTHLQNVPSHEKQTIFGCQWLTVACRPSRQLVWASPESCLISLTSLVPVSKLLSLS